MKRVLMISCHFPPVGGVSVMRLIKFAKFLPHNGWQPVVLTVKDCGHYYRDDEMAKRIPRDIEVYRTSHVDPVRFFKKFGMTRLVSEKLEDGTQLPEMGAKGKGIRDLLKKVAANLLIPDGHIGWLPFAVSKGLEVIKNTKIDVIYSNAPPWTAHLIGMSLKRLTGIPWVADFRDLWTERETIIKSRFSRKMEEVLEKNVLESADRIITVVESSQNEILKKFSNSNNVKFAIIHNGFDPDDFRGIEPKMDFSKFTLIHTGTVWPPGILKSLLVALCHIPKDIRDDIKVILLGGTYRADRLLINEFGLSGTIELRSFVSHYESLSYQLGADILLLLRPAVEGETALSGKLFEYFAAKKPILAIAPSNGVVASLIRDTKTGIVVDPGNACEIRSAILDYYEKYKNGMLKLEKRSNGRFKQFDRSNLTKKLAQIFDDLSQP